MRLEEWEKPHSKLAFSVLVRIYQKKLLTNVDLEKLVETNDAWIVERTGIRHRHIAADGEYTSDVWSRCRSTRDGSRRYHSARSRRDHFLYRER